MFAGFLCNLEFPKGRIIKLKRLVFAMFLYKEKNYFFLKDFI